MTNMTAALFDGKDTLKISSFEKPVVGPGEVMIRPRGVGICGSDLLNFSRKTTADIYPMGHEVAGEIVEIGANVDLALLGQRVAVDTVASGLACTLCWFCRMGQANHCQNSKEDLGGGFAEYMVRSAGGCYPLPDDLSWEEGSLVEPLAVSVHGLRVGELNGGETVVVLGSGTIGLTAVAAARGLGAGHVFATSRHNHQAELAKSIGADDAFLPDSPLLKEAVLDVSGGRGADITVETVGGTSFQTIQEAFSLTRHMGRIVGLGCFFTPISVDWLDGMIKEHKIILSNCYSVIDGRHDFEVAIDLMASGRIRIKDMVTHKFPLVDIQKGLETAYDKKTGSIKVQIHT